MACAIDKMGLGPRIAEYLKAGKTAKEIHRDLVSEVPGFSLSYAVVQKYCKTAKGDVGEAAATLLKQHVDKVLPDDLEALERLQALAMAWTEEEAKTQAERVADAQAEMVREIEYWIDELQTAGRDQEKQGPVARRLIKRALFLLAQDDQRYEIRLAAMKRAAEIITIKLRNAELLDGEGKGGINLFLSTANGDVPIDGFQRFEVVTGGGGDGA